MSSANAEMNPTLFGHPTGLFTLFFAEMWERFSYYGMRALLTFYMIKGFLGYADKHAYAIYGAYTALVYMTPYFGGMLADRLLGQRRAVVLGGLLMAAGHLLMTIENKVAFFGALALLICGNGFFKPNISTIVGSLYPKASEKKDTGFTIFYMGINLGAAMSPILCGYVGETYGWHYGFGLATAGMLVGVGVFVMPTRLTQLLVLGGSLSVAFAMLFLQDSLLQLLVRIALGLALATAGVVAFRALGKGGLPKGAGDPPDMAALKRKIGGIISREHAVVLGTLVAVPLFALAVWQIAAVKWILIASGAVCLGYLVYEATVRCAKVERERMFVVLVLFFFNMLFWAFFEQAGSSVNNFTDRNVDRVFETRTLSEADVGQSIRMRVALKTADAELAKLPLLSQEQLGRENGDPAMKDLVKKLVRAEQQKKIDTLPAADQAQAGQTLDRRIAAIKSYRTLTMTGLSTLRSAAGKKDASPEEQVVRWKVVPANVGMAIGDGEIPASEFQAANPMYILIFGLLFSALWAFLGARNRDPSTPVKFSLGLAQLGLGFACFWYGAHSHDARGMSTMTWLLLGYLFQTTGELCLSPVGLSMITKLSPTRLVSTVMGSWFLVTGFSNYLAGVIATFTGVGHGGEQLIVPPPAETVSTYGGVFGTIAITAAASAVLCLALAPILTRWMHTEITDDPADHHAGPGDGDPAEAGATS